MDELAHRRDVVQRAQEVDELLVYLNGLVRVRTLLARRGAAEAELEAYSAEIGRVQWRLAGLAKSASNSPRDAA